MTKIDEDLELLEASYTVYEEESKIDPNKEVYLFTWVPDPKELPNCDIINQHIYCFDVVSNLLSGCSCGLACVESTQKGNPHYHGWYQIRSDDRLRIQTIKVMQRLAPNGLTVVPAKHYRINSYSKGTNSLHYYKKDLVNNLWLTPNPVTRYSVCFPKPNYELLWFLDPRKKTDKKDKSDIDYLMRFYKDSL